MRLSKMLALRSYVAELRERDGGAEERESNGLLAALLETRADRIEAGECDHSVMPTEKIAE